MSIEPSPMLELEAASPSRDFHPKSSIPGRPGSRTGSLVVKRRSDASTEEPRQRDLGPELKDKVRDLIQLAHEQGYITRDDLQESVSPDEYSQGDIDEVRRRLKTLEIEVVEATPARPKSPTRGEDESEHVEALDDPVRMYLREMGQVKLLSREEEVQISKLIEQAEVELRDLIYGFGFASKEQVNL